MSFYIPLGAKLPFRIPLLGKTVLLYDIKYLLVGIDLPSILLAVSYKGTERGMESP